MLFCVDVSHHAGASALVGADVWAAPSPIFEIAWRVPIAELEHEPGLRGLQTSIAANRRHIAEEEPYLLSMLAALDPLAILFRGFAVAMPDRRSFASRLYEALAGNVPVIGITPAFESLYGAEEVRFDSSTARYVTAIGLPIPEAAALVRTMVVGRHIPLLVERARALVHGAAAQLI
ncbi:MAG TPA: hypothetical protein VGM88_04675 [Kofleriaceae bacterium]